MIQITQTYTFESDMGRITNPAFLTEFIDLIPFFYQKKFPCRSAEYEYGSMRCALSDSDRRTAQHFVQLVDTPGTDYFEVNTPIINLRLV